MGLSTGIGIGIQFSRGGGQSWESYWATRKPTGLTLSLIAGGVKIDWTDNSLGAVQFEIWGKNDSDEYEYIDTVNAGIITYSNICDPVDMRYYKVRGLKSGHYSDFTDEESIAMLGAEKIGDFKTESYWNYLFNSIAWTADGSVLSCNGNAGTMRRSTFYTVGSIYRTILTVTGTGVIDDIFDGNYPLNRTAPGTFINNNYETKVL